MNRKLYILNFIIISILSIFCFLFHFLIYSIGYNDLIIRVLASGIVYLLIPYWLYTKFNQKKVFYIFLIPTLFLLGVTIHSAYSGGVQFLALGVINVFSLILSMYIYNNKFKKTMLFLGLFVIFLLTYLYANWLYGRNSLPVQGESFPTQLSIQNENGVPISIQDKKGKVIVLDLWSSTCGVCFKKFPEFEKQYSIYKDDEKVELYTLYLPLKRDTSVVIQDLQKKYHFPKLYTYEFKSWDILNINSVPHYIIIDKKGKIRFRGMINTNKYLFYNNFNRLIEKLRNE